MEPELRIFISYRRALNKLSVSLIYRELQTFGIDSANIFRDLDSIGPGDYPPQIESAVSKCNVMLVVIGHGWLTVQQESGRRRLDDPNDFVRLEIESALNQDSCVVVPIVVEDGHLPKKEDLPESLTALASKQAYWIREDPDMCNDVGRLVRHLRLHFEKSAQVDATNIDSSKKQTSYTDVYTLLGSPTRRQTSLLSAITLPSTLPYVRMLLGDDLWRE